jgi:nucleotide-binding universal stress UspA family protein
MKLLLLKVVLAAIDYDDASVTVLEAARALANAGGAQLHVVHVDPPRAATDAPAGTDSNTSIDTAGALLRRADVDLDRARIHVIAGEPAHVIRTLADRIRADVIVLGPHRGGDDDDQRRLGSTALAIATASWAPCLIVARGIRLPLERVLVPVDLSDSARGAMMVALSWSSALRGGTGAPDRPTATAPVRLTALYIDRAEQGTQQSDPSTPQALRAALDRVRRDAGTWAGVDIEGLTLASGSVADAIANRAREERADLIVLGTRGLGLDAVGRLGSVSDAVIRRVDTPILLVPPAVWTEAHRE